jgi:hypothetical protein
LENLAPLTDGDVQAIIESFLHRYRKALSPKAVADLLRKSESHIPLYILTALNELRTLGLHHDILSRIRDLPGDTRALFAWIFKKRLSSDSCLRDRYGRLCGARLVEQFAAYLGISRQGLSQAEPIALIDAGDPLGNVAALLRLLRPYLMHRGELLDFFHSQLREAIYSECLHSQPQRRAAHRALAIYFHDVG